MVARLPRVSLSRLVAAVAVAEGAALLFLFTRGSSITTCDASVDSSNWTAQGVLVLVVAVGGTLIAFAAAFAATESRRLRSNSIVVGVCGLLVCLVFLVVTVFSGSNCGMI